LIFFSFDNYKKYKKKIKKKQYWKLLKKLTFFILENLENPQGKQGNLIKMKSSLQEFWGSPRKIKIVLEIFEDHPHLVSSRITQIKPYCLRDNYRRASNTGIVKTRN
jgi:hypothetical protein